MKHAILSIFSLFILVLVGFSQDSLKNRELATASIYIDQIIVIGNKKTKDHIISRELEFQVGDTINVADTAAIFLQSRNNAFNTGLFNSVKSAVHQKSDGHVIFMLEVKERWYLWPIPIFELADRNINEWIKDRGADPKRINIGIDFKQENFRGRNESLELKFQTGFTNKYEVFYKIPYIDKKRQTGLRFKVSYSTNRQVAYESRGNKLVYQEQDFITRRRFYAGGSLIKRFGIYTTHEFDLYYHDNLIDDTIVKLNPDYYLDSINRQYYFRIGYKVTFDKRDIKYNPNKGHVTEVYLKQLGLGIGNLFMFQGKVTHARFYPMGKRFRYSILGGVKVSLPKDQPYNDSRALGYEKDYLRGYELYVVDGQYFGLLKQDIRVKVLDKKPKRKPKNPNTPFPPPPLKIYLKTYGDLGWAKDENYAGKNPIMDDRLLYGYGTGVDFVTIYDMVFSLEYSWNHLGERGLFVHFGGVF